VNTSDLRVPRPGRPAVLLTCLVLSLGACGSGGSASSTGAATAASSPAGTTMAPPPATLCADAAALRGSVDQLANVTVAPGVADEMRSDLAVVREHLAVVVSDARGRWQAETDAVARALATLDTAIRTLHASPGSGAASNVQAAVAGVKSAVQNLLTVVRPTCPSTTPS
jgi:hypothetical protein